MYMKQIEQLVTLQRVDDEIVKLEQTLEATPKELARLEEKLQTLLDQEQKIKDHIDILEKQKSKLETDIEADNSKIKKSKNKLMMVENTKEYHAMLREMDNLEKTNRMREEELASLAEDLQTQNNLLQGVNEQVEKMRAQVEDKREHMQSELKEADQQLSGLHDQRENAKEVVPTPILKRYEFIRSRLNNPVIVPVAEGICCGCNISIPPQKFNELQRGEQIFNCPNCQRLIYWEEHFPKNGDQ
nr:C4-type zinc ribbon domain-containing protein [Desulfohalobium retbaense]